MSAFHTKTIASVLEPVAQQVCYVVTCLSLFLKFGKICQQYTRVLLSHEIEGLISSCCSFASL